MFEKLKDAVIRILAKSSSNENESYVHVTYYYEVIKLVTSYCPVFIFE